MADVTFTPEQQAQVDKLVGDARVKARQLAQADHEAQAVKDKATTDAAALVAQNKWQELAEQGQARIKELEPLEARVKEFEVAAEETLKSTIKELGEAAKMAVDTLPESMTATEKLAWLRKNQKAYHAKGDGVGTSKPAPKKTSTKKVEPGSISKYPIRL